MRHMNRVLVGRCSRSRAGPPRGRANSRALLAGRPRRRPGLPRRPTVSTWPVSDTAQTACALHHRLARILPFGLDKCSTMSLTLKTVLFATHTRAQAHFGGAAARAVRKSTSGRGDARPRRGRSGHGWPSPPSGALWGHAIRNWGHAGANRGQRPRRLRASIACSEVRVLLTNDDGIEAAGLQALRRALVAMARVELAVIAPDGNRSAMARSITTRRPLWVQEVDFETGRWATPPMERRSTACGWRTSA